MGKKWKYTRQITLGIDPTTGRRVRKRVYGNSKPELAQREREAVVEYEKAGHATGPKITYDAYEQKWFATYKSHVQPHTRATYRSVLKHNDGIRYKRLRDITRTDLQAVIDDMWDNPHLCRTYVSMMRSLWTSAIADEVCVRNPTLSLSTPKVKKADTRPLTDAELDGIRDADLDVMQRFLVDVLLQFGLRPGEALILGPHSWDKERGLLLVHEALGFTESNAGHPKATKNEKRRDLPVPDAFWERIPDVDREHYFVNDDGTLFSRSDADYYKRKILDAINAAMGGTKDKPATTMTLYTCRHHRASQIYYLGGISTKKKAQYMGHSERMFLETYSHMMEKYEDPEVLRQFVL